MNQTEIGAWKYSGKQHGFYVKKKTTLYLERTQSILPIKYGVFCKAESGLYSLQVSLEGIKKFYSMSGIKWECTTVVAGLLNFLQY